MERLTATRGDPKNGGAFRTCQAVNSTSGQVMTWQNRVFPAYFHSSCGGHTLDSAKVFNRISIKPLSGVACKYCSDPKLNKFAHWKKTYSIGTIAHRLVMTLGRDHLHPVCPGRHPDPRRYDPVHG